MLHLHTLSTWAHIACGVTALLAAVVPLLSRKGGVLHRVGGWAFALPAAVVVGCAAILVICFPQPGPLVAAALSAAYQYVSGMRSLQRFRPGPDALDAVLALSGLACSALIVGLLGQGRGVWSPQVGYPTLGFAAAVMIYDLSRHVWATSWHTWVRPLDHGLKMTGTLFAMLGAGLGNLLPQLQPWSSVGPAVLAFPVMALLTISYLRSQRRSHRPQPGADAEAAVVSV